MVALVEIVREAGEPWWVYIGAAAVAGVPASLAAWFSGRTRRDTTRKLVPTVEQINNAVNNAPVDTPSIKEQVTEVAGQVEDLHHALTTGELPGEAGADG